MQKERSGSKLLSAQNIAICVLIIIGLATNCAIHYQREEAEKQATQEHFGRVNQALMRELLKNPPDPSTLLSQTNSPDTP